MQLMSCHISPSESNDKEFLFIQNPTIGNMQQHNHGHMHYRADSRYLFGNNPQCFRRWLATAACN